MIKNTEEIIQTYSISNMVCFTSQQLGDAILKCDCILVQRRIQDEQNPYIIKSPQIQIQDQQKPFLSAQLQLNFIAPGNQKPPCCISISNCSSPVYRVPVLNQLSAPLIRVFYTPDVPHQSTNFLAPQYVPLPSQIDFNQIQQGLKNWHPPLRQISFTPWIQTQQNQETYVSTFGMIPNVIYQCKHQILDGQKKLELKQKVSFQAQNIKTNFKVQPCFAAEAKNRQFLIIVNNSVFSNSLENALKISENRQQGLESSIINAYGDCIVNYDQGFDKTDEFQIESFHRQQKNKIVGCNGIYTYMVLSDVCEYPCDFINKEATDNKTLVMNQITSMKMNCTVQQTFAGQKLAICYHNGIQKSSISCSSINMSLFKLWKKEFTQYINNGGDIKIKQEQANPAYIKQNEEEQQESEIIEQLSKVSSAKELQKMHETNCPKYRPIIRITTFQVLENGFILAAGQAEVLMQEYPIIKNIVQAQLSTTKYKKLNVNEMSILTAGEVLNVFYAIDKLPMTMNCVELVQLQISNNDKQTSDLPGFITKNGYAIVHSVINQLDTTNKDVLAVLPRQESILHLDYIKWTQESDNENDDIIMYQSDITESPLAKKVQQLIGKDLVPIAVARVSKRMLIMVNNKRDKNIELIQFNGMKDMNDLLSETDTEQILDSPVSTEARTEENEQTDQLKIISRIILQQNKQATDASILGQLKGGLVAAYKHGDKYELIELNRHNEVVFAENVYAKHLIISRII